MRVLVAIVGLLAGLSSGVTLLLLNPLSMLDRPAPLDAEGVLTKPFSAPIHRGLSVNVWSMLGLGDDDPDMVLDGAAIRHARIGVAILESGDPGPAALAVKLSAYSDRNDLLRGRLGMSTCWNIIWPGRGSIFLVGQENHWPMLSEAALAALRGDGFLLGSEEYLLTTRWSSSDYQGAIGASGIYEKSAGQFREFARPVDEKLENPDGLLAIAIRSE